MARIKRIVVPGYPHHVVQRGVRSTDIFKQEEDRVEYLMFLQEQAELCGLRFLAYCLMTNYVHLLAIPEKKDSLALAIGEAHRRYTRMINLRENVRGFLFQGRFLSCPVDTGKYLLTSVRYIEQKPVREKLVSKAWDYRWSSSAYHAGLVAHDPLVKNSDLFSGIVSWQDFLAKDSGLTPRLKEKIRTGRPFGPDRFYELIKKITGRDTRPKLPGRPRKNREMSL